MGEGGDFSRDGVSLSYPPDWKITEQGEIEGEGYYLCIETTGFRNSGVMGGRCRIAQRVHRNYARGVQKSRLNEQFEF